jgi:predicted SnoaL-like aldol condensation-catalyzing enzyme
MNTNGASQLLADSIIFHGLMRDLVGKTNLADFYPDLHGTVRDVYLAPYTTIAEGNLVMVPYRWQGVLPEQHEGDTPNMVYGNGVDIFRVENGLIAETWRRSEQHNEAVVGSVEDYRTTFPSMTAIDEAVYAPGAGMAATTAETPTITVWTPNVGVVELSTIPANEPIVDRWITALNDGKLDTSIMTGDFVNHECPCSGTGTIDLKTYAVYLARQFAEKTFLPWTPTDHAKPYVMLTQGDLTAVLFDRHAGENASHPESVAIFRLEDGKIAEQWIF